MYFCSTFMFLSSKKKKNDCTVHQLRYGRMMTWLDPDSTCGMAVGKEKEHWLGEGIFGSGQRHDHLREEWDLHLIWTLSTHEEREIVTLFGQRLWNPSLPLVVLVLNHCWGHVHYSQDPWCPFPCPRIAPYVVAGSSFTPLYWPRRAHSLFSSHYIVQQLY